MDEQNERALPLRLDQLLMPTHHWTALRPRDGGAEPRPDCRTGRRASMSRRPDQASQERLAYCTSISGCISPPDALTRAGRDADATPWAPSLLNVSGGVGLEEVEHDD